MNLCTSTSQAEEELERRKSIIVENKSRFCSYDHLSIVGGDDDVSDNNVDDIGKHRLRELAARVVDLESQMLSL